MGSSGMQLIILAGIAIFMILRLRGMLGTRDGFEPEVKPQAPTSAPAKFEVIEGGLDRDIYDLVDEGSAAGDALACMKTVEPDFSVAEFQSGAGQAYEMILMAFENGDLGTLKTFLSDEVYETFASVVKDREDKGLKVHANFVGLSSISIGDATFDEGTNEGEITLNLVGELTSFVRDNSGEIVEGDMNEIKKQKDVWTFARSMGSDDPNWELVATGG